MSLDAIMTALAEYVQQVLVDECDRPAPDRVLRYFGHGVPQDCCTEAGVLSVAWDRGFPSESFPTDAAGRQKECSASPTYALSIFYDTCWKAPEVDVSGVGLIDSTWDADAAMLARTADCVARWLLRFSCGKVNEDTTTEDVVEKADALAATLSAGCSESFAFREVVPIGPGGSCARLIWRVYAGPRSEAALS